MKELSDSLARAFRKTTYWIQSAEECVGLRIDGSTNPRVEVLLQQLQCASFAIITSDNPRAQRIPEDENETRRIRLGRIIEESQFEFRPTRHVADDNQWPVEHGYAIFGLSELHAEEWGRRFEQSAIVYGSRESRSRLVVVNYAPSVEAIGER